MGPIIGIYKVTNKINKKIYIGLSKNIEKRWQSHVSTSFNEQAKDYNSAFHQAIRKYGHQNFIWEIIETFDEYDYSLLTKREQYWIAFYNSYKDGYNETIGGEIGNMQHGETHNRAKLTEKEVIDIRTRYENHERCCEVYELYKDKIGRTGFNKVWKGETWQQVKMDVYTPENKAFHKKNTGNAGSKNGRAKLNQDMVNQIREEMKTRPLKEIWQEKYAELMPNYRSFYNSIMTKWQL